MKKSNTNRVILPVMQMVVIALLSIPFFAMGNILKNGARPETVIHEEKFIKINGIEQWVTIHGESTRPVILMLHGGPGSPISPYSAVLYKDWEKDFMIVQWDQRGTGKTFGRTAPAEITPAFLKANPLTVEQMVTDGIELTEYLIRRFDKQKIILFGTSWGSVLGVKMATKNPALFYAYVGHSQITDPTDDLSLYNKVHLLAEKNNDSASLIILNTMGVPPYPEARNMGKLFRIVKKYERMHSLPAPDSWFVLSSAYDNAKDNQNREDGDDYSFVNYVGDKKLGILPMRTTINLAKDHIDFKIPVYLIQGEEDLLTPKEASKKYFDSIKAPEKKYFLLPKTAHGFNEAVVETQYKIFKTISDAMVK